ncbi:MAG: hypothetical protein KDK78_00400 [Chlamydiia bacterium]|nr:hypothetical protein [Chlamydiia bacterium]
MGYPVVLERKIRDELAYVLEGEAVRFQAYGTPAVMQYQSESMLLQMRALLYRIEDFYPERVKGAVAVEFKHPPLDFPAQVHYCPESKAVYLDASCDASTLSDCEVAAEAFLLIAALWRQRLEDLDDQDRVRVYVR